MVEKGTVVNYVGFLSVLSIRGAVHMCNIAPVFQIFKPTITFITFKFEISVYVYIYILHIHLCELIVGWQIRAKNMHMS